MFTLPERLWLHRGAVIVVRRHDAYAVWTWLALARLTGASFSPTVSLHGPLHYVGIMDPLCGATRSFYLTLHGRLGDAVRYNPAGPLFVVAAVVALSRAVLGHTTRRWVHGRIPRRFAIAVGVVAIVGLEVNQQSHAALLMAPWSGA